MGKDAVSIERMNITAVRRKHQGFISAGKSVESTKNKNRERHGTVFNTIAPTTFETTTSEYEFKRNRRTRRTRKFWDSWPQSASSRASPCTGCANAQDPDRAAAIGDATVTAGGGLFLSGKRREGLGGGGEIN